MQVLKYGIFLVLGIAAQACGGGSDGDGGDGGGDDDDSGGSSSGSGGSSSGGSSSGKGGSSSGSANGGSATGGSSSGGSANGGSANGGSSTGGTGSTTCPSGSSDFYDDFYSIPQCKKYYDCVIEGACASSGTPQAQCEAAAKESLKASYCLPSGTPISAATYGPACDAARMALSAQYPTCAN